MKLKSKTTATLLIAIFMISAFAVAISASPGLIVSTDLEYQNKWSGTSVVNYGMAEWSDELGEPYPPYPVKLTALRLGDNPAAGAEGRIRVNLEPGTKLGDIKTISWEVYLKFGYLPHVDIALDIDAEAGKDIALTAEYAYANDDVNDDCLIGEWISTFQGAIGVIPDDFPGGNPRTWDPVSDVETVNGETAVWEDPGGPVTLAHTLSEYQTATLINGINEDAKVLYLEIEVDDWAMDTEAFIRNVEINGESASVLTTEVYMPVPIVAISVDSPVIDFGPLEPGQSATEYVGVTNEGNVLVSVSTTFDGPDETFYENNMDISGLVLPIGVDATRNVQLDLDVPEEILPRTYTATLVFWAEEYVPS